MRDLNFYLTRAIERSGVKSDRQLSHLLGLANNAVNVYKSKGVLPNDETMIKLSKLAGVDPALALIDLSIWRTDGEAKKTYASILQKFPTSLCIALFSCQVIPTIMYIMENNIFSQKRKTNVYASLKLSS